MVKYPIFALQLMQKCPESLSFIGKISLSWKPQIREGFFRTGR